MFICCIANRKRVVITDHTFEKKDDNRSTFILTSPTGSVSTIFVFFHFFTSLYLSLLYIFVIRIIYFIFASIAIFWLRVLPLRIKNVMKLYIFLGK